MGLSIKGLLKWNRDTFYKIKVVVLSPGCNVHVDITPKTLPHKVKVKTKIETGETEKEYIVDLENLWKVKYSLLKKPWYYLKGIKGVYLCMFRSNEDGKPIKIVIATATPKLIRNVKKSRILKMALSEVFSEGMGGFRKFIVILLVTAIGVYLAYSQGLIG